jgi:hemoglobin-like flavoprotein
MQPQKIYIIQATWSRIMPIADTAADLFYTRLFQLDPAVKPLFKGDRAEQGRKLIKTIDTMVNSLSRLDEILPAVEALGRRHVAYGVEPKHYDTVGAALLWTLEQALGDSFTPAARDAWNITYQALANIMKDAACPNS